MQKKILIIGDSGRGKTTFAGKLSKKLNLTHYSTDDFFWKVKFSEPNNKEESIIKINKIYDTESWVVDGGTRHLIKYGLERADIVLYLKFNNILFQYYSMIKRNLLGKDESFIQLWKLLKYITYKKYKKGYAGHSAPIEEMLAPYVAKVVYLNSFKQINKYLESIK